MNLTAHGFLVLDKEPGVSSARAIGPVKRSFPKGTKVGHAGTLDPFATGALLVLVGDATRLSDLAMGLPKEYEGTVRFGTETDTLDPTGAVVAAADPGAAPPANLAAALAAFTGEIEQAPPAFSALKIGGRPAYRLARQGEVVELAPRRVRIDAAEVVSVAWPDVAIRVRCGAGTYIRSLARDFGRALGRPAHLNTLRRARIGPFAPGCGKPEDLRPPIELARAAGLTEVRLSIDAARDFAHGRRTGCDAPEAPRVAVLVADTGALLGLGRIGGGFLVPETVLAAAAEVLA